MCFLGSLTASINAPESQIPFIFTEYKLSYLVSLRCPLHPCLRCLFQDADLYVLRGKEGWTKEWGVTRAAPLNPMSSLFLLSKPAHHPPSLLRFLFMLNPPTPPPPLSTSVSYFSPLPLQYGVCGLPFLEVSRTWAGKLCTFPRPRPATRRMYRLTTGLAFRSALPCRVPRFSGGVFFRIWSWGCGCYLI